MRSVYRHIPPLTVLYARCKGPYLTSAGKAWDMMGSYLEKHKARRYMRVSYGLFRDNPRLTAPELVRYDACIPLIPGLEADPALGIGRQTLPGGAFAVHTHLGAHAALGELFSRLYREEVPIRGLTVDFERPFLATYLTDPNVTREIHRRTEICVPVNPLQGYSLIEDKTNATTSSAMSMTA